VNENGLNDQLISFLKENDEYETTIDTEIDKENDEYETTSDKEIDQDPITQEKVNEFFKEIKTEWNKMAFESGQSEPMFIAINKNKLASNFLGQYQQTKEEIEKLNLEIPILIHGLNINF
jgi:hypothetical protein